MLINPTSGNINLIAQKTFSSLPLEMKQNINHAANLLKYEDYHLLTKIHDAMLNDRGESYKKTYNFFLAKSEDYSLDFKSLMIAKQMVKLLEDYLPEGRMEQLNAFNNERVYSKLTNPIENSPFGAAALFLYFLPVLMEGLKINSFLHMCFIQGLSKVEASDLELDEAFKRLNEIVDHFNFSTPTQVIFNLDFEEMQGVLDREEILEGYYLELYDQTENFEKLFDFIDRHGFQKNNLTVELQNIQRTFHELKIEIEKMIEERAEEGEISKLTVEKLKMANQNFVKSIQAPMTELKTA